MELNRNQALAFGVGLFVVLVITVLLLKKLMATQDDVALSEVTEAPELTLAAASA
ncbi:MAG: hypothetical protein HZY76_05070 [Anaerolineae bacterium]|nr:MAG: hypothetical protein HZY76_05070 [Anaerolineae bacterium]